MDCTRDFAKRKIAGTIAFLNLHKKPISSTPLFYRIFAPTDCSHWRNFCLKFIFCAILYRRPFFAVKNRGNFALKFTIIFTPLF